ncbi:MAG: hypothetical protein AMXMBFR64_35800 [Myxococcales bacterium]
MFSFKAIELMNWDLWDHIRVPVDEQVVMIAGPNGSGKTTFLDSMRILLGARTLSTSRKVNEYMRGETGIAVVKGVVSNPLRRGFGKRPFTHRGIFQEEATLACVLTRKSGHWNRRYAILPGDAPIQSLRDMPNLLSPEEYAADLEKAHLPRTLLKILALEQGETNKLCRRTPQQLLEYVLEMQGDKQVMDNYATARESYLLSARELREQEEKAYEVARHVQLLERDAKSYERFRDLVDEERQIREVRLPAVRYKSLCEQRELLDAEIDEALAAMAAREADAAGIVADRERTHQEIERLQSGVGDRRAEQQAILREKEGVDGEYRTARVRLREIEELREKLGADADAEPVDPVALEAERRRLLVAEAGAGAELQRLRGEQAELRAERRTLSESSRREPPPWVRRMGERLAQARIEAVLVLDVLEIVDPKWQLAVESVLGRDRFTWIVPPEASLPARELARELKYPCYVSTFERVKAAAAKPRSALSQVVLGDDRVPSWILSQLDRVMLVESVADGMRLGRDAVSITPDGYKQDPRGGVHIAVQELYCGGGARKARLDEIQRREGELEGAINRKEHEAGEVRRALTRIDLALDRERARARLAERAAEIPALEARSAELAETKRQLSVRLMDAMTESDGINGTLVEKEKHLGLLDYRARVVAQESEKARADLAHRRAKRARVDMEVKLAEAALPELLRTEAALALTETEEQLGARLRVVREAIDRFEGCQDPQIVEVFEKARADLDGQQRVMTERQTEHRRGEMELRRARKSYIRVMEQTVQRYRRNIMGLAERARVEVEVHVPKLVDDDEVLKKAGIDIRIGFDGKSPVPINDPKLSGGQSVIASLILLMALTMQDDEEPGGFFILDEPFAHLSVERIDDITRFLNVTRAQFILTTPTTHNLMVYNPARLTLNLRKKLAAEDFAPVPTFLRR